MRFREHRGTLAESLATTTEIHTRQELIDHLQPSFGSLKIKDVVFSHYGYDKRIDWDTWMVSVTFEGQENKPHLMGMSDAGEFKDFKQQA